MKAPTLFVAALFIAGAVPASLTQAQTETVVAPVIVTGEVIRYEPGKILVVRHDGREMTYTLSPTITVPSEVQVGRVVSVATERGRDGNTLVTRVTTTSVTPEGQVKRTTEETRIKPTGESSKVTTVTVQGTVQAFVPGKSITVQRADGTKVLYVFGSGATLPADIQVGKAITIQSMPVVETIIIDKQP